MDNTKKRLQYSVNPALKIRGRSLKDATFYIEGIKRGDRFVLSEAITLVESDLDEKNQLAGTILEYFYNKKYEQTTRLAITGTPGVGKSTFIENYGMYLVDKGHRLAVLAIDPSSQANKGSILGDKTRMKQLGASDEVFIRPTSSGTMLGGVAKGTKEAILMCEYAGFDTIIIETVGVGQSEYLASKLTDLTVLLIQPGAGDEMQGIKRGILEITDILVVHKADGDQLALAKQTVKAYESVLPLFQPRFSGMKTAVCYASSLTKTGYEEVEKLISFLLDESKSSGYWSSNRIEQEVFWFESVFKDKMVQRLMQNEEVATSMQALKKQLMSGQLPGFIALRQMETLIMNILKQ